MSDAEQRANKIRDRMAAIRSRSQEQKIQFVDDSARLLDWKEHVRAIPVTALLASTIAGFALIYRRQPKTTPLYQVDPSYVAKAASSGNPVSPFPNYNKSNPLASTAMSMLTTLLLTTGKQYLLKNLQSFLLEKHHEPEPNRSSVPQSERST